MVKDFLLCFFLFIKIDFYTADTLIFKAACGVLGCREIGNAKNPDSNTHKCLVECPYNSRNWDDDNADKSARLSSLHR